MSHKDGTIGDRMRQIRGDMNQSEFAMRLRISKETLGRYERNERQPDSEFLTRLYQAVDVDITWLVTGAEKCFVTKQLPPIQDVDPELNAIVIDGISQLYDAEDTALAATDLGRIAAQVYSDLVVLQSDERTSALKGMLAQLRRQIRQKVG